MKKNVTIVAAALAGLLGFGSVAVAAPVIYRPSKTVKDAVVVTLSYDKGAPNFGDTADGDDVAKLTYEGDKYEDALDYMASFDAESISDAELEAILAITESDQATAHEFAPLVLDEYDGGGLNFKAKFPTDYKYLLVKTVAVYINVIDSDGVAHTYVVKGEVTDDGLVLFHVDEGCAQAIWEGTAYFALFSAE